MTKIKFDGKLALALAAGGLSVLSALVSNKQKANEKEELIEETKKKVLESLNKKEG